MASIEELCHYDGTSVESRFALRAPNSSPILTMSSALLVITYIVTWSSFLVAIASCILRIYCCRSIKRRWKADDFMSLIVGVSAGLNANFEIEHAKMTFRCSFSEPWVFGNEPSR